MILSPDLGGAAIVHHVKSDTVTVKHADDRITVSLTLLAEAKPEHWDGHIFTLDTAGEYRYRPTGEVDERDVVFERVH